MAGKISAENGKKGGRPKGAKNPETIVREAVMREYRNKVLASADILFQKQLHLASGQTFLYKIEKELQIGPKGGKKYVSSRPKLVTNQSEIEDYLMGKITEGDIDDEDDPNETYYFLTTERPDIRAIDSMFDRANGKPAQSIDMTSKGESLQPLLVKIIGNEQNDGDSNGVS